MAMRFFAYSYFLTRIFAHSCIRCEASAFVLQSLSLQIAFSFSFLFSSLQILLYRKIVSFYCNEAPLKTSVPRGDTNELLSVSFSPSMLFILTLRFRFIYYCRNKKFSLGYGYLIWE